MLFIYTGSFYTDHICNACMGNNDYNQIYNGWHMHDIGGQGGVRGLVTPSWN